MTRSRTSAFLLAPLGVSLAHTLAYRLAHQDPVDNARAMADHGHLPLLAVIGVAFALSALVYSIARSLQGREARAMPGLAVASQLPLFGGLELIERIPGGAVGSIVQEPAVWLGLGIQAIVAVVLTTALDAVRRAAVHLIVGVPSGRHVPFAVGAPRPVGRAVTAIRAQLLTTVVTGRGPPRMAISA